MDLLIFLRRRGYGNVAIVSHCNERSARFRFCFDRGPQYRCDLRTADGVRSQG